MNATDMNDRLKRLSEKIALDNDPVSIERIVKEFIDIRISRILNGGSNGTAEERIRLISEMSEVSAQRTQIESRISQAKTRFHEFGERSDTDWLRRANAALRFKGQRLMQIQALLRNLKTIEQDKRQNDLATGLYNFIKENMGEGVAKRVRREVGEKH